MDQHQLARIRLLSSRFLELQGLRVAMAGATLSAVLGGYMAVTHPTDNGALVALGAAFLLMLPGQWWAHRYYANTVGRQVPEPKNRVWTVAFLLAYFAIGTYLDRSYPEFPAGTPTTLTVVLFSMWVAIRDWRWRGYYAGVAAAVALTFGTNVVGVDVIDRGKTLAATLFATGLSFMAAGLLDHRLLIKLMKEVRQPERAQARP